jgi:hypothetical protein
MLGIEVATARTFTGSQVLPSQSQLHSHAFNDVRLRPLQSLDVVRGTNSLSMVYTSITLCDPVSALLQHTRLVHAYSLL